MPSESPGLTMSTVDEFEAHRLDTAIDVSPPRKPVRFADWVTGRLLVAVCSTDSPVRCKQVPVRNKQVHYSESVPRPCRWMSKTVMMRIFTVCTTMINVRDRHLYLNSHLMAFTCVDVL